MSNRYSLYGDGGVYDGSAGNMTAPYRGPPARAGTFPMPAPQQQGAGYSYQVSGQQYHQQHAPQRSSTFRPTSSIYSNDRYSVPQQHQHWNNTADISPPSSPEALEPRKGPFQQPSPDISPIDEESDPFAMSHQTQSRGQAPGPQSQPQNRSNIPSIAAQRRERRQTQDAAARTLRETKSRERMRQQTQPTEQERAEAAMLSQRGYKGGEVRWDPRTGELTSDTKGRPSQVKPKEYASGLGITTATSPEPQPVEAKKPATSFGDRMRKMAKGAENKLKERVVSPTDPAANAFQNNRPAWNGASGRSTIVAPVQDTRNVAPLRIPQKVNRPVAAPSNPSGLDTIMASPPVSPPPDAGIRQVVPSSQIQQQPAQQPAPPPEVNKRAYPSPPMSAEPHAAPSPTNPYNKPIKRKPPPQSAHQPTASVSSTYSQSDIYNYNNYPTSTPPRAPAQDDGWVQPPSRFSVTTYDATPRDSADGFDPLADPDAPPLPNSSPNPDPGSSVMDRSRPSRLKHVEHSPGMNSPIKISIAGGWQTGTGAANAKHLSASPHSPALRPESTFSGDGSSIYKVLPPAPPEEEAKDRVTQLNAQLANLAQRRANIMRGIKQMTELMPMDNLMASAAVLHKRELEKRKVEGLRLELSEIQREEYELGLKLHRAYKRLDRDAEYEPTTLWVRRVTG